MIQSQHCVLNKQCFQRGINISKQEHLTIIQAGKHNKAWRVRDDMSF